MYSVVGSDGQVYGPVDMATLTQWIAEGRVTPTTNLIDPLDGRVIQAGNAPALMGNFPSLSLSAPPMPGPYAPTNPYDASRGTGQSLYQPGTSNPLTGYPRNDLGPYYGPPKSKVTAIVLALFLGGLGVHRFYLGHTGTGVAMLLLSLFVSWWTCGIPTLVWAIVDVILISSGSLREANGRALV